MTPREIRTAQASRRGRDLLQSIFAAELLVPSTQLWLVSPWISDVSLLDNTCGQFAVLLPEYDRSWITLSQLLIRLATGDPGTQVHIVTRQDENNRVFVEAMEYGAVLYPGRIFVRCDLQNRLHEKGFLADRWYLEGSLNLTFRGLMVNREKLLFHRDPQVIAENRIEFEHLWGERIGDPPA